MTGLWHQVLHTMSQPGASPDDDLLAQAAADIALRDHPGPPADAEAVLEIARSEFAAVLSLSQAQAALDRARRLSARNEAAPAGEPSGRAAHGGPPGG
ncbi:hypothetical protein ACIQ7D_19430 [Streptomyces sp. NPDC096310]|uniref:hypothetical protein n=1 Tax=Streptomyces sp. NPDC096310 TaxID=3366082 RepID=UPI00380F4080